MNQADTINAKEIRQDLEGFLRRIKTGKPITVIYRSKPYVTINDISTMQAIDAPGSTRAVKRSLSTAQLLRESTKSTPVSATYHDLLDEKYDGK